MSDRIGGWVFLHDLATRCGPGQRRCRGWRDALLLQRAHAPRRAVCRRHHSATGRQQFRAGRADRMIPALTVLATATTPAPLPVVSSAGVFDNNDRLVRTLWSAQTNDPRVANPAAAWDGTLDDLSVAPTGTYNIKVLTGSTSYTWDGVVGNSCPNHSPDATDNNLLLRYLQGTTVMWSMTITDAGDVFYCNAYHEKNSTVFFTTTSDMNHGWNPIYYPGYGVFGGTSGSLTWGTVGGGNNQYHYSCTDGSVAYLDASDVLGVVAITGSTKVQIMYSGDPLGRIAIYDNSGGVGTVSSSAWRCSAAVTSSSAHVRLPVKSGSPTRLPARRCARIPRLSRLARWHAIPARAIYGLLTVLRATPSKRYWWMAAAISRPPA